jgi:diguanylate cyclase (GGDEF)-like protein
MDGFVVLVNGLGLMALVAALFGVMIRARVRASLRDVALGAVFGFCAGLPGIAPAGQGADPQIVLMGFAAAFMGLGGVATALAFAFVLHALPSGSVEPSQVAALLTAAGAGLLWSILVPARWQDRATGHAFLGLFVAAAAALPALAGGAASAAPGSMAGAACPGVLLAMAMGGMVARERAQLRREKALVTEARTDALTGLPNRRALSEWHDAACRAWPAPGVAVMILDLDRFKAVNDTHGHAAGDVVLGAAARRVAAVCAAFDEAGEAGRARVARLGGEEFAVHLAATSRREALALAEAIRAALAAAPVTLSGGAALSVTGSIGVAWSGRREALAAMLEAADVALYAAKQAGRNCVRASDAFAAVSVPRATGAAARVRPAA